MSGFDDAVASGLAEQETKVEEGAAAPAAGVEARSEWYAESEALRVEVRDSLVRRRVPLASGQIRPGAELLGRVTGWALPGGESHPDWFLDTDANFYSYRLLSASQTIMYFDGRGEYSNFILTGPTTPDGDDRELDAFRAELVRRVVDLIPRFGGRTQPGGFTTGAGVPIAEEDLAPEVRAQIIARREQ